MPLSSLSPFGPIFGKELRTAARRRRNYLLRVVYLLALLLFLLLAYTITRAEMGPRGVAARAQQHEQLGWIFFMFFSMFTVIAMGLVGPVLTSTAINSERLHKTLHVLLMTPLTAWQIVSGKLFSRLLTALTLIGLSLPVLALVRLLGGVELQQMFGVVALCIATAMTTAALGLLMSILLNRAYAVILLSYVIIGIVYLFAPSILMAFVAATGQRAAMRWMELIAATNPFWCTAMISSGQMRILAVSWVPCVLVHLGLTAVLLVLSAILVRRLARRAGESAAPDPAVMPVMAMAPAYPESAPAKPQAAEFPPALHGTPAALNYYTAPPRRQRSVSDYPVLWRELRRPLMAKHWQRFVGVLVTAILLVLTYVAGGMNDALNDDDFQIPLVIVFYTLLMLLTCVLSATAIAQEKEGDTWTVLLVCPLSGVAIVFGKALGVMRRLLWPMALIAAHVIVFTLAGVLTPACAFVVLWVMVTFNLQWLAAGIFLSLQFRKVTIAVIVSLALPVALYGALSLVIAVLDEAFHMQEDLLAQISWYLPYYYLIEAVDAVNRGTVRTIHMPALDYAISYDLFAFIAFVAGAAHVAVAGLILWATAWRFDSIVGRAKQRDPLAPTPLRPAANLATPAA